MTSGPCCMISVPFVNLAPVYFWVRFFDNDKWEPAMSRILRLLLSKSVVPGSKGHSSFAGDVRPITSTARSSENATQA